MVGLVSGRMMAAVAAAASVSMVGTAPVTVADAPPRKQRARHVRPVHYLSRSKLYTPNGDREVARRKRQRET